MLLNHLNDQGKNLTIEVKRTNWSSYGVKSIINKWIEQTEKEESICILWKPDRLAWRMCHNMDGSWLWVEGEERHKNVLGILTERK